MIRLRKCYFNIYCFVITALTHESLENYLNNYFFIVCTSDALPYTRTTRIPRLLQVRNYFNNYFAMYTRLTRSRYT